MKSWCIFFYVSMIVVFHVFVQNCWHRILLFFFWNFVMMYYCIYIILIHVILEQEIKQFFNMILLIKFHSFLIINSCFLILNIIFLNFLMFINNDFFFQDFWLFSFYNTHNFKNLNHVQSRIWTVLHNDYFIHFHLIYWHTDILSLALNCAHVSSCFQIKCESEWIVIL